MVKNPHAVALGRLGGKVSSPAKTRAVRANGMRGGRPCKAHGRVPCLVCRRMRGRA
jgi:hypothetical protein